MWFEKCAGWGVNYAETFLLAPSALRGLRLVYFKSHRTDFSEHECSHRYAVLGELCSEKCAGWDVNHVKTVLLAHFVRCAPGPRLP